MLSSSVAGSMEPVSNPAARFGSQADRIYLSGGRGMFGNVAVRLNSGQKAPIGALNEIGCKTADACADGIMISYIKHDGTFEGDDITKLTFFAKNVCAYLVVTDEASKNHDFLEGVKAG